MSFIYSIEICIPSSSLEASLKLLKYVMLVITYILEIASEINEKNRLLNYSQKDDQQDSVEQ